MPWRRPVPSECFWFFHSLPHHGDEALMSAHTQGFFSDEHVLKAFKERPGERAAIHHLIMSLADTSRLVKSSNTALSYPTIPLCPSRGVFVWPQLLPLKPSSGSSQPLRLKQFRFLVFQFRTTFCFAARPPSVAHLPDLFQVPIRTQDSAE